MIFIVKLEILCMYSGVSCTVYNQEINSAEDSHLHYGFVSGTNTLLAGRKEMKAIHTSLL